LHGFRENRGKKVRFERRDMFKMLLDKRILKKVKAMFKDIF